MIYNDFIKHSYHSSQTEERKVNNTIFYLKNFVDKDKIEFPFIFLPSVIQHLRIPYTPVYYKDTHYMSSYKGITGVLNNCGVYNALTPIKLADIRYFTGAGIICTNNFIPLLITYLRAIKKEESYCIANVIVHINKYVFNHDDTMSKSIRTSAIKQLVNGVVFSKYSMMYSNALLYFDNGSSMNNSDPVPITINISDMEDIVVKPSIPDINFNENSVNELLKDNAVKIANIYDY